MRLSRFPAGMKPLQSDLNAISENVEGAFSDLFTVFSNNTQGVLFDALPPVVTKDGTNLTILTPAQRVGIVGNVESVKQYSEVFDVDDGLGGELDLRVEIYFVFSRVPVTATRNFLSIEPIKGVSILQNFEAEIATHIRPHVVYLWTNNLSASSEEPVVGPNDVGYIKLATVVYTGVVTITDEPQNKFTLPNGVVVPTQLHANQHMPGGSDPIPVAALTNTLSAGSSAGLMPIGALATTMQSLQNLVPNSDSPFLSFSIVGTNTLVNGAYDPRIAQVSLKTDASLTVHNSGEGQRLAVRFAPKGATAGQADEAARRDHIHALSESGIVVVNLQRAMTPSDLGTLITTTVTAADLPQGVRLGQILDIKYYWQPNNLSELNSHDDNMVAVPWIVAAIGSLGLTTVGVRTNILSRDTFQIEVGVAGLAYLTAQMQAEVESWTAPQYSQGAYPSSGTLHMVVIGLREGANG